MFNLMASRDTVIHSFDIYTGDVRNDVIEVYTRPGGYKGHEVDESGWILVYSKPVSQMGRTVLTELGDFDTGVTILGGSIQSFYIYSASSNYVMYDTGSVEGGAHASDASLTLYQGRLVHGHSSIFCLLQYVLLTKIPLNH